MQKKKICTLLLVVAFSSGCSQISSLNFDRAEQNPKEFSCEQKAKPKSLQLLEQQYRCNRH